MIFRIGRAVTVLLVLVFAGDGLAYSQTITSIDVQAEINNRLATKGPRRKQRVVQRQVKECETRCCFRCEVDCERCFNVTRDFVETYTEPLRVTGVSLQVVDGRVAVDTGFTVLPDKVHFHDTEIVNCSATRDQSETKTLAVQFQTARTTQMTRAVTHSQQVQANIGFSFPGIGSAGLTISGTDTVQVTNVSGQTKTDTITATNQVTVTAAPMTTALVSLQIVEGGVQATFRGRVIADGPVDANIDGITAASQLLSAAERTFDIEGTLTVTSASSSRVIRHDRTLTASFCDGKPSATTAEINSSVIIGERSTLEPMTAAMDRLPRRLEILRRTDAARSEPMTALTKGTRGRASNPGGTLLSEGTPGGICYIGPCNMPLDGTRPVCYFDEDGACFDCGDEPDSVCTPDLQPNLTGDDSPRPPA
jgi:hypothetical protein